MKEASTHLLVEDDGPQGLAEPAERHEHGEEGDVGQLVVVTGQHGIDGVDHLHRKDHTQPRAVSFCSGADSDRVGT
jgi:hypothetical protein